MTGLVELQKEIDRLPSRYYGEVYDFVGFLRQKAQTQQLSHIPETMLLSEAALSKDWDTPEEDEAWANL